MCKWKVGERVVVVNPVSGFKTGGKVKYVYSDRRDYPVYVSMDTGHTFSFTMDGIQYAGCRKDKSPYLKSAEDSSVYKPSEKPPQNSKEKPVSKEQKIWVVKGKGVATTFLTSYEDAEKEAQRLAGLSQNIGQVFHVMQSVAAFSTVKPPVSRLVLEG